jgi:hypothetical protein
MNRKVVACGRRRSPADHLVRGRLGRTGPRESAQAYREVPGPGGGGTFLPAHPAPPYDRQQRSASSAAEVPWPGASAARPARTRQDRRHACASPRGRTRRRVRRLPPVSVVPPCSGQLEVLREGRCRQEGAPLPVRPSRPPSPPSLAEGEPVAVRVKRLDADAERVVLRRGLHEPHAVGLQPLEVLPQVIRLEEQ